MHNWVKCRIIIEKQIKGIIFADSIVKQFAPGKGWKMLEGRTVWKKGQKIIRKNNKQGKRKC